MNEKTKEQLHSDLYLANQVIVELQARIGELTGANTRLAIENRGLLEYCNSMKKEEEKKEENKQVSKDKKTSAKK